MSEIQMVFVVNIFQRVVIRKFSYANLSPSVVFTLENKTRCMKELRSMPTVRLQSADPPKKAAILVPLCVVNEQVCLLYTLRSHTLTTHRNQVSFPGGMVDSVDKSPVETALRETNEELGIDQDDVTVWGMGNSVATRGETSVTPVIGNLRRFNKHDLDINRKEVESVFTVPLEKLCDLKNIAHTQFKNGYSTPVYLNNEHRIWGFTALITHLFLKCLLPEVYKFKLPYIPPMNTQKQGSVKSMG